MGRAGHREEGRSPCTNKYREHHIQGMCKWGRQGGKCKIEGRWGRAMVVGRHRKGRGQGEMQVRKEWQGRGQAWQGAGAGKARGPGGDQVGRTQNVVGGHVCGGGRGRRGWWGSKVWGRREWEGNCR